MRTSRPAAAHGRKLPSRVPDATDGGCVSPCVRCGGLWSHAFRKGCDGVSSSAVDVSTVLSRAVRRPAQQRTAQRTLHTDTQHLTKKRAL